MHRVSQHTTYEVTSYFDLGIGGMPQVAQDPVQADVANIITTDGDGNVLKSIWVSLDQAAAENDAEAA
jgi:hypothetical protein